MKTLKNTSLLLGLSSTLLISAPFYLELKTGLCFPQREDQISYKKSPTASAELGYRLTDNWRLGAQMSFVQYVNKQVEDGTKHRGYVFDNRNFINNRFSSIAGLVNVYYDFKIKENISFNLGIGGGLTQLKYHFFDKMGLLGGEKIDYNLSKIIFCVQFMAGITYDINAHWALSLGYRCMKMENLRYKHDLLEAIDCNNSLKTPYLHSLELGLRYSF